MRNLASIFHAGIKRNIGFIQVILVLMLTNTSSQTLSGQCQEWELINPDAEWISRAGLQAVNINEEFYIMGGRTPKPPSFPPIQGDSEIWNDVWKSTDKGLQWERILESNSSETQWPARAYFQAVTKNDSIFILGGQNYKVVINPADSSLISQSDFFNDVWVSANGIDWEELTENAGWSGRAGLSSVVYNNEIYVMGGSVNDDAAIIGGPPQRIYYNDVWKSTNGSNWELLTEAADWAPRAGGIAVVKDNYIYMIGGEEGFLCFPGGPCPPYFNDVWRTQDGINWDVVNSDAPWASRPGHQCVVADNKFVLFGGFGLNPINPFAPANPIDTWISNDGIEWESRNIPPWNAAAPTQIKYDFDAIVSIDSTDNTFIYTFGGDRETFNFADPTNYLNIDNDVWRFCIGEITATKDHSELASGVEMWPNPTQDYLFINSESEIRKIEIFDLNGKLLIENRLVNPSGKYLFDRMSILPEGVYLVNIHLKEGMVMDKIIKL